MPPYNGVSAAVLVDGKPLDEYQTHIDHDRKEISCWIGSQVGKEFSITVHSISHSDMKLDIEMDGNLTNKARLRPQTHHIIKHCPISETAQRPFIFSRVQLVDDDELLADSSNLARLGTIKLTFTAVRLIGQGYGAIGGINVPGQRRISEKRKKGIQACVSLGPEQHRAPTQYWRYTPVGVVAQLVFQYRPLEYLQAQGIAPIPPPPPPLRSPPRQESPIVQPSKRKSEDAEPQPGPSKAARIFVKRETEAAVLDISDEEDIEKLHALRARIDRALAKKGPSNVRIKKEVKKEFVSVFSKGEIIDLT